ncbi:MAG: alpha/beta hydrolase [Helicobacteraceae bacterium]|nr:alpha/beta hydrolase [Helicobacteraceae bacterium]
MSGCASYFFYPNRDITYTPDNFEVNYESREITSADNTKLFAWILYAKNPKATIVYFHGNAGNISYFLPAYYWLPQRGFNVLAADYRGYGASGGEASVEGALLDVASAIKYAIKDQNLSKYPIVVLGQSLGGALSITAIAKNDLKTKISLLITEGSFTSYETIAKDVAKRRLLTYIAAPFLSNIVDRDLDPINNIEKLENLPILITHGDRDNLIPVSHARDLYDKAKEPKELSVIFGGWHINNYGQNSATRDKFAEKIYEKLGKTP